jgi:hypothetical protein
MLQHRNDAAAVARCLLITDVALAFVLLTGAGLLIRSFFQIQQVETGFDATNVITAVLPIPEKRFRTRLYSTTI